MALTVVQNKGVQGSSANGSSGAMGSTCVAGNLIVIAFGIRISYTSVTIPTGFTLVTGIDGASSNSVLFCWKISDGTETTFTFTHISSTWCIEVWEINESGGGTWVLDQQDSRAILSATTSGQCTTGITPTASNSVAFVADEQVNVNSGGETVDSGFTARDTGAFDRMVCGEKIKTSNAAENPTCAWVTARTNQIIVCNFKISGAPSAVPHSHGASVGISLPATVGTSYGSGEI